MDKPREIIAFKNVTRAYGAGEHILRAVGGGQVHAAQPAGRHGLRYLRRDCRGRREHRGPVRRQADGVPRPPAPRVFCHSPLERARLWRRFGFNAQWNLRDVSLTVKIANLLGVGAGDIVRWHIYGDEGWIDSKIAAIYRDPTALVSAGRVADSFDGVDAVLSTADIVSAWEDFLMALMVVYDSKTGLGRSFAERVSDNTQSVEEALDAPCLLVTRNVGLGKIPGTTNTFLKRHAAQVVGVVVNGDRRFGKHYCAAGPKMQAKYGVRIVRNIERDGDDEDVRAVTEFIKTLGQDVL